MKSRIRKKVVCLCVCCKRERKKERETHREGQRQRQRKPERDREEKRHWVLWLKCKTDPSRILEVIVILEKRVFKDQEYFSKRRNYLFFFPQLLKI